jgi:hypothetical protein
MEKITAEIKGEKVQKVRASVVEKPKKKFCYPSLTFWK